MIQFGTGGFRGIIGEDFNKENIQLISQALCEIAIAEGNDKPVAVGYDYRFISDRAAVWIAEVLAANGIKVLLFDQPTPTPVVMYCVKEMGLNFGAMITASHNPYHFNGVKLFLDGGVDADIVFTEKMEIEIRKIKKVKTVTLEQGKAKGLIELFNNLDTYLSFIETFISSKIKNNNAKFLFNNLNGVGAIGLVPLAKRLNIKQFDVINTAHDAFFSFSLPNPVKEVLLPLAEKVIKEKYDLALATDSDADRLGILDENGKYVDSNDILGALYYYLCIYRGEKGDIVKNCATSLLLDKLAIKLGFKCHEVDVGFKNVSGKMTETDALIGGESSGGLTVRDYIKGKDSVFSSALFMEMVIVMNKPVSEIINEVHEFAKYDLDAQESTIVLPTLANIEKYLSTDSPKLSQKVLEVRHFGRNHKYILERGWALLRMSGTEPAVRVFAEMGSMEDSLQIIVELTETLKQYA